MLKKIVVPSKIEMHFCVVGPRRVGKTTLLTAIYDSISKIPIFAEGKYLITFDEKTKAILSEKSDQLKKIANQEQLFMKPDFQATSECTKYCFSFGYNCLKTTGESDQFLETMFYDFPGGWTHESADKDSMDEVYALVKKSQVTIVIIDTPSLIESEGDYFSKFNIRPDNLEDYFKKSFTNLKEPRLVILVPVRCEKYFSDPKLLQEMMVKIEEKYHKVLRYFASPAPREYINCAIIPACTMGNFHFHSIIENRDPIEFRYKKKSSKDRYSPKNCDHLMLRILYFMLRLYEDRDRYPFGLNILKRIDELKHVLQSFKNDITSHISKNNEIKILQGEYIKTAMD